MCRTLFRHQEKQALEEETEKLKAPWTLILLEQLHRLVGGLPTSHHKAHTQPSWGSFLHTFQTRCVRLCFREIVFLTSSFSWDLHIWIDWWTVTRLDMTKNGNINDHPLRIDPRCLVPLCFTFFEPKVLQIEDIFPCYATVSQLLDFLALSKTYDPVWKWTCGADSQEKQGKYDAQNEVLNRKNAHNGYATKRRNHFIPSTFTSATHHITK